MARGARTLRHLNKGYVCIHECFKSVLNVAHMKLKHWTFLNTPTKFYYKPAWLYHQLKLSEMSPRLFSGVEQDRTRES